MHKVVVTSHVADERCRDTVGGSPHLPAGEVTPVCQVCKESMALFFQFDVRAEFGLPFQDGSHLLAFMCPTHNEASGFPSTSNNSALPAAYWDATEGHFSLLLYPPTELLSARELDLYIEPYELGFEFSQDEIQDFGDFPRGLTDQFKIGGVPGWMNYQIDELCSCGGKMSFVCQTPDGFGFRKTRDAPEQPDSFSGSEYCLFLGNQAYVMACDRQCHPRAVIAGCDN